MGITVCFTFFLVLPSISTWGPGQIVMFGFTGWSYYTSLSIDTSDEDVKEAEDVKEKR